MGSIRADGEGGTDRATERQTDSFVTRVEQTDRQNRRTYVE